ncbi:hypothetical protein NKG05_08080 [Oerskovia sp. M15]
MRPDLADEITAQHEEFARRVTESGFRITGSAELRAAGTATLVRPGVSITEGPYTELAEQIGGFYVVASDDLPGLVALVDDVFAGDGCTHEIRPTVDHADTAAAPVPAGTGAEG